MKTAINIGFGAIFLYLKKFKDLRRKLLCSDLIILNLPKNDVQTITGLYVIFIITAEKTPSSSPNRGREGMNRCGYVKPFAVLHPCHLFDLHRFGKALQFHIRSFVLPLESFSPRYCRRFSPEISRFRVRRPQKRSCPLALAPVRISMYLAS